MNRGSRSGSPSGTQRLNRSERRVELPTDERIEFHPFPHPDTAAGSSERSVWRLQFAVISSDPVANFGLDVNGEIVFGRGTNVPNLVDLTPYDAATLGVSRQHLMLRPTDTKLYAIDLGSTNGTKKNGISIGVNSPYDLSGQDLLELGDLRLMVTVVRRPKSQTGALRAKADLADALLNVGKAITSQLKLDEVLRQVLTMAMSSTSASEASIWLVDDTTNELFLEAELGIKDEHLRRERLPLGDTVAGEVVKTGEPHRASKMVEGERTKAHDPTLGAQLYVPLTLGGVTVGVLGVASRQPGASFDERDEKLLVAIGEFAAIAIQNSRLYQATNRFLSLHVEKLDAYNQIASAISAPLNLSELYEVLIDQVSQHWPVDRVELWLLDETEKVLIPFSELLSKKDVKLDRLPHIGEGVLGEVAKSGKPKILTAKRGQHLAGSAEPDEVKQMTLHLGRPVTLAHIPLHIKGRVVGVMTLHVKAGASVTAEDIERLQAVTSPAAVAIQNVFLLSQSERERSTVRATADLLPHPLLIVNDQGKLIISNHAASRVLEDWEMHWKAQDAGGATSTDHVVNLVELIKKLSSSVGHTNEITIGDRFYLTTIEHEPRIGTIILLQDITGLRKLEQTRAELVGALAHDVRGPLTSIRGFARLLQDARTTPDESAGFVEEIVLASDRIITMVRHLLDAALLGVPSVQDQMSCDLKDTVAKAMSDLRGTALEKAIQLELRVSGSPCPIKVSAITLYRSVLNLIDNAIKYSPRESTVHVELIFEDEKVTVKVRDEGKGIGEEDMPHIFDRYFRAHEAGSKAHGVGLGLALVKATANSYGGGVSVRNMEGQGAEFAITLPGTLQVK